MRTHIANITRETLPDLFLPCRACCYWEYPQRCTRAKHTEEEARLKAEWFERTAKDFEPCGKLLCAGDEPAAYCQYAPPRFLPGVAEYPQLAPRVDSSAVFISCLFVPSPAHQRKGLGRRLLSAVIGELAERGFKAVETFGRDDDSDNCSGPTRFYLAQGFEVVATETYPNGASFSLVRLAVC
jgi:GNAT superfamily N-acetyltransferase